MHAAAGSDATAHRPTQASVFDDFVRTEVDAQILSMCAVDQKRGPFGTKDIVYPKDAEGTPGPASAHQISEATDDGGLADAAEPPVLQPVVSDGRYRGEFERGHWHGKGLLVHLNGDIYDGHFHYDVKHGAGTYVVAATGSVFVGEWVNGEPEGDAEVTFQNGEKYSGQVARGGVFQGKGTYAWPDGARYDGEWLEGLMHGQGRYLYANGDVYEGGFRRDQRHGVGRLVEGGGAAFAGVFDVMFEYGQMVAYSKAGQGVSTLVDRKVVHAQRTAILQREVDMKRNMQLIARESRTSDLCMVPSVSVARAQLRAQHPLSVSLQRSAQAQAQATGVADML